MKNTKDLLKDAYRSIPHGFAYREIKFYVHQAMQRLETLEKRTFTKKKQTQEEKLKEEKRKSQPWMPPIYQDINYVKQTLSTIDKMIENENKMIENSQNKKIKKTEINEPKIEDNGNDLQTFHG